MSDEILYLQATEEVESTARIPALWAKSIALAEGDLVKAKYKYIKLRVEQLNQTDIKPERLVPNENLSYPFALFNNMTNEQIIQTINQPFYDDITFKNGFERSGEFSFESSKLLKSKGRKLLAIHLSYIVPSTTDESSFKEFTSGRKSATTISEKTWEKYITLATEKPFKLFSSRGAGGERDYDEGDDRFEIDEVDSEVDNGYKDDGDFS